MGEHEGVVSGSILGKRWFPYAVLGVTTALATYILMQLAMMDVGTPSDPGMGLLLMLGFTAFYVGGGSVTAHLGGDIGRSVRRRSISLCPYPPDPAGHPRPQRLGTGTSRSGTALRLDELEPDGRERGSGIVRR